LLVRGRDQVATRTGSEVTDDTSLDVNLRSHSGL
jgi:hypothetical protein